MLDEHVGFLLSLNSCWYPLKDASNQENLLSTSTLLDLIIFSVCYVVCDGESERRGPILMQYVAIQRHYCPCLGLPIRGSLHANIEIITRFKHRYLRPALGIHCFAQ